MLTGFRYGKYVFKMNVRLETKRRRASSVLLYAFKNILLDIIPIEGSVLKLLRVVRAAMYLVSLHCVIKFNSKITPECLKNGLFIKQGNILASL